MDEDLFNVLDKVSEETLLKALTLAVNPPVETLSLDEALAKTAPTMPLQPAIEYIEVDGLRRSLGSMGLELFLALDQVVSLLPYSLVRSLKESGNRRGLVDVVRRWSDRILENLGVLSNLRPGDFRGEDEVKEEVLLALPSRAQVENVKGKQGFWLWKERARGGVESPDFTGLTSEITAIGDTILSLGVKVSVAVDSSTYDLVKSSLYKYNVVVLDMPVDKLKLIYVRDQSVTWFSNPVIGNMALPIRRGEEEVVNEVYYKLNIEPLIRVRWARFNGVLVRAVMEGGNFFVVKGDSGDVAILTGVGVRGSNWATFKVLGELLPEDVRIIGVPLAGYMKYWDYGAVHLDVAFSYIGDLGGVRVALVDPSRLGFYSLLEYDRRSGSFKLIELPRLARELGITLDEPPREGASLITMVNALNLGRGRLVVDGYNEGVNRYLEKTYGVEVFRVEIPHLEAGGGGVRCATRELWRG